MCCLDDLDLEGCWDISLAAHVFAESLDVSPLAAACDWWATVPHWQAMHWLVDVFVQSFLEADWEASQLWLTCLAIGGPVMICFRQIAARALGILVGCVCWVFEDGCEEFSGTTGHLSKYSSLYFGEML